ncbi:terminase TerL endonuclease subunit [Sphingomonas azotifigens]|uniref:terminase TerL endonuclease subunit n=1 Tax=Sphingomonas azotifigens TaxID=330920 RepID=UPI0009FF0338|nr:terminase TerL endonuclease subunit [Sphingomonas azotifigens]
MSATAPAAKKKRRTSSSADDPRHDRVWQYATRVVSGKVVAGPHVRNACRRHLDDLERAHERGLHYDADAAARAMRFFETRLKLSEGQFEGKPLLLHESQAFKVGSLFGWKRADDTRRFRRAYIEEGKGNGKALALDTPIPTPSGWTTMGDLNPGDWVFDDAGCPCRVVAVHPISYDRECYRLEFDAGEPIIASAEHLWLTEQRTATQAGQHRATKGVPRSEWGKWRKSIRTTRHIAATLRYANGKYQSANHSIALCGELSGPVEDLPIEPYGLGVWLGDGDSDCARITIGHEDAEQTIGALHAAGWVVSGKIGSNRYRIADLNKKLRSAGLLGNKHIPPQYLRACPSQRWALLQGLMDTDGTVSATGQCEFTQVKRGLAEQVLELVLSLGMKATMATGVAMLNGRAIGPKYRVTFHPRADQPCFRLPRKLERIAPRHNRRRLSADRKIIGCEPVAAVPVRCITVDSVSSMFLAGRSMIPTHNSPIAGGIGLYGMMADNEAGAEIYAAGATKQQAGILFNDAVKMVDKSPELAKRVKQSGGPGNVFNMAYLATNSFFRPISREAKKTGSGPRPHFALCDEVHEHPDRGVMEMLERGFKFRRQPLLFMITNSGSDRNSICWEEHEHAIRCAAGNPDAKDDDPAYLGKVIDDTTFAYVCALDKGDDPLNDPSCWPKANPLLGVTITEEYLAGVVAQAKMMPGKLNGILRLHFCVWTDAEAAWMTRAALEPCLATFSPSIHYGKRAAFGVDLSQTRDITAKAGIVETGTKAVEIEQEDGQTRIVQKPTYDAWIEAWTPGDTLAMRALADKAPYEVWVADGHLKAPKGKVIAYEHVAQAVAEDAHNFDVIALGYDRYAYRASFEPELRKLGIAIEQVEHPQGGTRKGKPTEAMILAAKQAGKEPDGLWMPSSVKALESMILEERIRLLMNPVLISAIMSAVTDNDRWGNYWLAKERAVNKIDAVIALCMAVGVITAMPAQRGRAYQMIII